MFRRSQIKVKMWNVQKTENDYAQMMTLTQQVDVSYVKPQTQTHTVQIRGLAKD